MTDFKLPTDAEFMNMDKAEQDRTVKDFLKWLKGVFIEHPETVGIVEALISIDKQELEAIEPKLEQHHGDYKAISQILNIQPSPQH